MTMKKKFIAAAVQVAPVLPFNKKKSIDKACEIIAEASSNGAELVVFPEGFIPMFPNWTMDLSDNQSRWEEHLEDFTDHCMTVPGPEVDQLCAAARKHSVFVAIGINEVVPEYDGVIYNSLLSIDQSGQVVGNHRKLFPTSREKLFHARGDSSTLKVYDTSLGRIGGLICYEHLQPLLKYSLIAQGEQIHCAVWPGWPDFASGRSNRKIIDTATRAYALEGQCFVVASSLYVPPESSVDLGNDNWSFFGGSCIVSPSGEYVAEPLYDQEGIVYGEIDLDLITRRKATVDVTGRDSASEFINLQIKNVARNPIEWINGYESERNTSSQLQDEEE